jgi:hypothetical protein
VKNIESDVERYFSRRVKALHGKTYKFISPGNAGVPDRITIFPDKQTGNARIWFVELKRPGKSPRVQQKVKIRELELLGAKCAVIDSKEAVDRFLYRVAAEVGVGV